MHLPLSPRELSLLRKTASPGPATPRSPAAAATARLGATKDVFYPQQSPRWFPAGTDWAGLEAVTDTRSKQELIRQLRVVTRERDLAVSNSHMNRLEASHLREEKGRLHTALRRLEAQHRDAEAEIGVLEGQLAEASPLDQASLWHSYCATRKKMLGVQEDLTAKESVVHRLTSAVRQEEARSLGLQAELAAAQAENAALQAALEAALQPCTALVLASQG